MPKSRFTPPFTLTQQKVLALTPKVTAVPSMIGSLYILQDVIRMKRSRRTPYHRLLGFMSAMDFIYSCKAFVSTWPLPENSAYLAMGTTESCEVWAFLGHGASLTSILYNGSLALYFFMSIVLEYKTLPRHVEILLHAIPWSIGWSTAAILWPLDFYNPIGWTCWIGSWPPGCQNRGTCTRGEQYVDAFRWAFFHAPAWFTFLLATCTLTTIYLTVRRRESAMERYAFRDDSGVNSNGNSSLSSPIALARIRNDNSSMADDESAALQQTQQQSTSNGENYSDEQQQQQQQQQQQPGIAPPSRRMSSLAIFQTRNNNIRNSQRQLQPPAEQSPSLVRNQTSLAQRVAVQACLYQTFFFLTWIFPMIQFAVAYKTGYLLFPLLALTVIFNPLQGFFDAIIYIRPRYLKYYYGNNNAATRRRGRQQQQQQQEASAASPSVSSRTTALIQAISLQHDNDFRGEIYEPLLQQEGEMEVPHNETDNIYLSGNVATATTAPPRFRSRNTTATVQEEDDEDENSDEAIPADET